MADLKPGDIAPDFTLAKSGGEKLSLHDLRGRDVILYFYPKDDTSGCTTEACGFRDLYPDIETKDAVVVGVSPDDVASHDRFAAKYDLPFALLADTDHSTAETYGAWKEKRNHGKTYMGIERNTYLIGPDGRIKKVWTQATPAGHAEQVLEAISS
jgi:thioredoxin-dependent peroxiredoxin